jgi:uncharacterized protein (DUF2141 family)
MISSLKKIILILFLLLFFELDSKSQLIVEVTNIEVLEGRIELGLYDDPNVFLSTTEQYRWLLKPVDSYTVIIAIDSIPEGWYAISLMHDLNSNGEMEKNFIGIPLEPYGFSKNIKPRFSKPDFEDAQFYYNGISLNVKIELIQ